MRTIRDALRYARNFLEGKHVIQPKKMGEEILAKILKMSRMELYLHFDKSVQEDQWRSFLELLRRKATGEPIEYILRDISFYRCKLTITKDVLIPRQETELFLYKTCEIISKSKKPQAEVWDICCGSGCLGLSLKMALPDLHVVLSDISAKCIQIAKQNAKRNALDVAFFQGDLLEPFIGRKADYIICNPPYVSSSEYEELDISVKGFEPKQALIAGETGLEFYKRLADELPKVLNSDAKVFFEIGAGQGPKVMEIFKEIHWKSKYYEKDWAGHDRFFFLEFQSI